MKEFFLFLILFSLTNTAFAQSEEYSEATTGVVKGIKKTEIGQKYKRLVKDKIYDYVGKDIAGKSAYALILITQKFRIKKDAYMLDLNLRTVTVSLGVNYDF